VRGPPPPPPPPPGAERRGARGGAGQEKKTKWLFKHAERLGAKAVVLIGDAEAEQGVAKVWPRTERLGQL
jgi:hypothetical protein